MVGVGFFFLPFLLDPIKSLHFCKKDFFTVDIAHPPQKWKANTYKSLIFTSQTAQPSSHSKPQQPFQNPEHEKNMNCLTHTSSLLTQIQRFSAKKKATWIDSNKWKITAFENNTRILHQIALSASVPNMMQQQSSICTPRDNRDSTPCQLSLQTKKIWIPSIIFVDNWQFVIMEPETMISLSCTKLATLLLQIQVATEKNYNTTKHLSL